MTPAGKPDSSANKPEGKNFIELAELKRQEFLKKKADSRFVSINSNVFLLTYNAKSTN